MNLCWLGTIFLSTGWLYLLPLYGLKDSRLAMVLMGLGLLMNITGSIMGYYQSGGTKKQQTMVLSLTKGIVQGSWLTLLIIGVHSIIAHGYFLLAARVHKVSPLSPLIYFLTRIFGLNTSISQGKVFVQTFEYLIPLSTNLEKLQVYFFILFFTAAVVLWCSIRENKKGKLLLLALLTFSFMIIRYIVLIFIYTNLRSPQRVMYPSLVKIFWSPGFSLASFLPLCGLCWKFFPLRFLPVWPILSGSMIMSKATWLSGFGFFLALAFLTAALQYQEAGRKKQGRLVIDEYHSSKWEQTTQAMDKDWYGSMSVYNYYTLIEWLKHYYTVEVNQDKPCTSELLQNYDLLILKTPTKRYLEQELKDIEEFVRQGGGLYLVGDHTNLLGMSTYLNQVATRFGFRFRYDSCNALSSGDFSSYTPPILLAHPITQPITRFNFMTSCSLEVPWLAENVMLGTDLQSDAINYGNPSFFGNGITDPDEDFGIFVQSAARKVGQGRVAAFTDSTIFSSFCLFQDGHEELFLRTIDYLNRENTTGYLFNKIFLALAIFSLALALALRRLMKDSSPFFAIFLVPAVAGFLVASLFFRFLYAEQFQTPPVVKAYRQVCFLNKDTDFQLIPALTNYRGDMSNSFSTFYVWTQRLGLFPYRYASLEECFQHGDILVIINPRLNLTSQEIDRLKDFIYRGGRLLLMDDNRSFSSAFPSSGSHRILEPFGLKMVEGLHGLIINGGQAVPLRHEALGENQIRSAVFGRGRVVAISASGLLSDVFMGNSFYEPDEPKLRLYQLEYQLFEEHLMAPAS